MCYPNVLNKEIIITFESEDTEIQDCIVYSGNVPKGDAIPIDEIKELGVKKMMRLEMSKQLLPEKVGMQYQIKITEEQLKELFNL